MSSPSSRTGLHLRCLSLKQLCKLGFVCSHEVIARNPVSAGTSRFSEAGAGVRAFVVRPRFLVENCCLRTEHNWL